MTLAKRRSCARRPTRTLLPLLLVVASASSRAGRCSQAGAPAGVKRQGERLGEAPAAGVRRRGQAGLAPVHVAGALPDGEAGLPQALGQRLARRLRRGLRRRRGAGARAQGREGHRRAHHAVDHRPLAGLAPQLQERRSVPPPALRGEQRLVGGQPDRPRLDAASGPRRAAGVHVIRDVLFPSVVMYVVVDAERRRVRLPGPRRRLLDDPAAGRLHAQGVLRRQARRASPSTA